MSFAARRPRARGDLILRQVEEDLVVYDAANDSTSLLNLSAAVVLDLCDGSRTLAEIVRETARYYAMAEDRVRADVEAALEDFAVRGFFDEAVGE